MLVRGPSAADGYWNQREKSRSHLRGRLDAHGRQVHARRRGLLHLPGRTDDMFKVSGIWVSPFEVESALIGHAAGAGGRRGAEGGRRRAAKAQGLHRPEARQDARRNGLPEELKEHVKAKAGIWKYPRWIEFVDGLPKTATGKIQRFKLREM